jgi:hypothetical protein
MTRLLPTAVVALVLAALCCGRAAAQLVIVQPGFVKAPFVRVYTAPDGSSFVRAPFVGIYSPGPIHHFHHYHEHFGHQHFGPTPQELAEFDAWTLRRVTREAAGRLDAQLSRFPTGDVWRRHFQTRELAALPFEARSAAQGGGAAVEDDRGRISAMLATYDAAASSVDLRDVAGLDSFRVLHAALRELALPPEPRLRRQLAASARYLDRALGGLRTGESWQRYLALPEGVFAAGKSLDPAELAALPDAESLAKVHQRFESVNSKDEYRGLTRMSDFQQTRRRLAQYVELRKSPATPDATPEELPRPK